MAGIALFLAFIGLRVYQGMRYVLQHPPQPRAGEVEFRLANNQVRAAAKGSSGNSQLATSLALEMSKRMQQARDEYFTKARGKSLIDSHDVFKVYCELSGEQCVFLVHIPELRRFNAEAQESLGTLAWITAQALLKEKKAGKPGLRLALGMKGVAAYDRIITGTFLPDFSLENTGATLTNKGFGCERVLYAWFASEASNTNTASVPKNN